MNSSHVQGATAWATSAIVMWAAVPNGSIMPAPTSFLCFVVLLVFMLQSARDFVSHPDLPARRAMFLGLLWFIVLLWLLLQQIPGLPEIMHHPVWALAPAGSKGTISADPEGGQMAVMRLICYAMIFWIAVRSAGNPQRAVRLIRAFALFSAGLALYGIFARILGYNVILGESERNALRATFYNRNSYATYAVFGALANVVVYTQMSTTSDLRETRSPLRDHIEAFFRGSWVYALGALLCFSAVAMTASRAGGMAGVFGALVLIIALRRKSANGSRVLLWGVPLIVLGFVLVAMSGQTLARFDMAGEDGRFIILPALLRGISDRPLLGHGADAFLEAFRPYVPVEAGAAEWQFAHDTYLEIAFEFGLPAGALFLSIFAIIGVRLVRGLLTRRRSQSIPSFAFACFAAASFHSCFDFSLQIPGVAAAFAWILGLGWAQSFTEQEKAKGRNHPRPFAEQTTR